MKRPTLTNIISNESASYTLLIIPIWVNRGQEISSKRKDRRGCTLSLCYKCGERGRPLKQKRRICARQLLQQQPILKVGCFIRRVITFLDFVYWLTQRSDAYEDVGFVIEFIAITQKIIHFRNVPLFLKIVEKFVPIYLNYLYEVVFLGWQSRGLMTDTLGNKDVFTLLNTLLLTYPLSRSVLVNLQPSLLQLVPAISYASESYLCCNSLGKSRRELSKLFTFSFTRAFSTYIPISIQKTISIFFQHSFRSMNKQLQLDWKVNSSVVGIGHF